MMMVAANKGYPVMRDNSFKVSMERNSDLGFVYISSLDVSALAFSII